MKKTLFPIAAIAFSLAACVSTPKFTIKGTIEGEQEGKQSNNAYLVNGKDTLAQATITNGKFVLTGNVANTTSAYLILEGKRMGLPIILENAKYTVDFDLNNPTETKIEGTENQGILNEFMAIQGAQRMNQSRIFQEYREAATAKDTAKLRVLGEEFEKSNRESTEKQEALIQD
nr:DUF4369 domain-containing protein [Odoribacter sp.]